MTATAKRRLRILAVFAVVAAVLAGTTVVYSALTGRRHAAAVARLDAAGEPWRLDDLVKRQHAEPLADGDNLAVALVAARAARGGPGPETLARRAELVFDLRPNVRLTRDQWRAVIDCLEASEGAIAPALDLDRYPRGRHPVVHAADGLSTMRPHLAELANFRGVLDDLRLAAIQRGDAATALRVVRATLNLGRSLRGEPGVASQFWRTRFRKDAVDDLERLLGHVELTDAQLAAVEGELRAELADDLWLLTIQADLAQADRVLTAIAEGRLPATAFRQLGPPTGGVSPSPTETLRFTIGVGPIADADYAAALDVRGRAVEAAKLPWPERLPALRALQPDGAPLPAVAPDLRQLFGHFARDEARVRCALAAVVVERYRLAHGTWPKALADAGAPPDDPSTGKPLAYKRVGDGVIVEAADPGTRPGTALRVRLWDVPHRNRSPGTAP